ncbi:hypothetical protein T265_04120 [Opisthorchis viverrini]|uniref:Uncharacterized protein n=1 Tax=Opisthorchis viverrini TaxID=6198 RepID=A0A075A115_OPIVI|nr:hypothetical protein T265_04120 [Opisthorchis viverrini]KER29185.1 hypothetical protein T265_04120 [Opisthorchis viverrini]
MQFKAEFPAVPSVAPSEPGDVGGEDLVQKDLAERSSKSRIVTIRLPFDESTIPVAGRKSLPLKNAPSAVLAQSSLVRNERDLNRSAGLFPVTE